MKLQQLRKLIREELNEEKLHGHLTSSDVSNIRKIHQSVVKLNDTIEDKGPRLDELEDVSDILKNLISNINKK